MLAAVRYTRPRHEHGSAMWPRSGWNPTRVTSNGCGCRAQLQLCIFVDSELLATMRWEAGLIEFRGLFCVRLLLYAPGVAGNWPARMHMNDTSGANLGAMSTAWSRRAVIAMA